MFTPAPNVFQTAMQTMGSLDALRQRRLQENILRKKMQQAPHLQHQADMMNQAKLANVLAQTGLLHAREKGMPLQQQQAQALMAAKIHALSQQGHPMGITASGVPVMMPGGGATSPAAAPSAGIPGAPLGAAAGAPQAPQAPQAAQGRQDVFMPSAIGKTKGTTPNWVNPFTGETISSLTTTGRNRLQKQYAAMKRILPLLHGLRSTGTVGTLGGPSVWGQDIKQWEGMGGHPESAALYQQTLQKMREFYPAAAGIQSTEAAQNTGEHIYSRDSGEMSHLYGKRVDKGIGNYEKYMGEIQNVLKKGGYDLPGDKGVVAKPAGSAGDQSKVVVIGPNGKKYRLPASQLQDAISQGYKRG